MEPGLLLIRLVFGLALAAHGAQKLFGTFGGHGIAGTGGFFEALGFRPGKMFATLAGLGELGGGLAFAAGLFTPLAAAVVIATMLVAIFGVHLPKGFFGQNGGYEMPLLFATVATALAATGPGRLSVDATLGIAWAGPKWAALAVALGLVGALPPLLTRRSTVQQRASISSKTAA
jgi:putative oxidoreductase